MVKCAGKVFFFKLRYCRVQLSEDSLRVRSGITRSLLHLCAVLYCIVLWRPPLTDYELEFQNRLHESRTLWWLHCEAFYIFLWPFKPSNTLFRTKKLRIYPSVHVLQLNEGQNRLLHKSETYAWVSSHRHGWGPKYSIHPFRSVFFRQTLANWEQLSIS